MRPRIVSVEWSHHGAPPEAVIEALAEAALTVAALEALLEASELRTRALEILRSEPSASG